MSNEITATKPPVVAFVLAALIALADIVLISMLIGPSVVDLFVNVWTFAINSTAWIFDHTVVPIANLVMNLFG
jgi:hypothetical protein